MLVVIAHNLVDDILPVTVDVTVKQAAIVEGFGGWQICLTFGCNCLQMRPWLVILKAHQKNDILGLTSLFQADPAAEVNSLA